MNLVFSTDEGAGKPDIDRIRFMPEVEWLSVEEFSISENSPGRTARRWALAPRLRVEGAGTHAYHSMEISANGEMRILDLGTIAVETKDGPPSGVFVVMASGGVSPEPAPYEFRVENTTSEPVILRDVVLPKGRIRFGRSDVRVGRVPLGFEGVTLEPAAETGVSVLWTVDWPDKQPVNVEARGLLMVERKGTIEWVSLHNTVSRNDPARG